MSIFLIVIEKETAKQLILKNSPFEDILSKN